MKKLLSLLLALVMLLSLPACAFNFYRRSSSAKEEPAISATSPAAQPASSSPQETTPSEDKEESSQDESSESPESAEDADKNETALITADWQMGVIDNEECAVTLTGIEEDGLWGYTVKALLENKSSDKTYMFAVESAAINGVQCDLLFASEVPAGKKSNEEIIFADDELRENGITEYTNIELTFRVYDSDNWDAEDVARETVHIYPYGEDKVVQFVREMQSSDYVIVDNDYVTAIVTGYDPDGIWGYTVNLFLVNKTDKTVIFSADGSSVNGFMADPFYVEQVFAGKCAFSSMSWADTTLEENDITEVETIEFVLRAYNGEDWFGEDYANEAVTLNP